MFSYLWIFIVVFIVLNKKNSCNTCNSIEWSHSLRATEEKQEILTELGEDTVSDIVKFNTEMLIIQKCPFATISEGAFGNHSKLQYLAICQGNVVKVPARTFDYYHIPELGALELHDNKISTIGDGAFSNMHKLKNIVMAGNRLTFWERSWFFNTTNVEEMDFRNNKIEVIPKHAFQGMFKLKELNFDSNEIKSIEPSAFFGIRKLDYLGLRFNRLKELDGRIFPNELSVVSLYIDGNYLSYLSNKVLKKLSVMDLSIFGNPWKCPCLESIYFWLHSTNGTLRTSSSYTGSESPLCIYPEGYSMTCPEFVDQELTLTFIDELKNLKPPLSDSCARLD